MVKKIHFLIEKIDILIIDRQIYSIDLW